MWKAEILFFSVKASWLEMDSRSGSYAFTEKYILSPFFFPTDKVCFLQKIISYLLNALTCLKYFEEKEANSVFSLTCIYYNLRLDLDTITR